MWRVHSKPRRRQREPHHWSPSTGGSESSSEPSESASELSKLHFNGADDRGLVATVEHVYEDGQLIESNAYHQHSQENTKNRISI